VSGNGISKMSEIYARTLAEIKSHINILRYRTAEEMNIDKESDDNEETSPRLTSSLLEINPSKSQKITALVSMRRKRMKRREDFLRKGGTRRH